MADLQSGDIPQKLQEKRKNLASLSVLLAQQPELARVVASWPELPEVIRRAILALVENDRYVRKSQHRRYRPAACPKFIAQRRRARRRGSTPNAGPAQVPGVAHRPHHRKVVLPQIW
jgi:hypothetical protein